MTSNRHQRSSKSRRRRSNRPIRPNILFRRRHRGRTRYILRSHSGRHMSRHHTRITHRHTKLRRISRVIRTIRISHFQRYQPIHRYRRRIRSYQGRRRRRRGHSHQGSRPRQMILFRRFSTNISTVHKFLH